jgi:hypothetical protein
MEDFFLTIGKAVSVVASIAALLLLFWGTVVLFDKTFYQKFAPLVAGTDWWCRKRIRLYNKLIAQNKPTNDALYLAKRTYRDICNEPKFYPRMARNKLYLAFDKGPLTDYRKAIEAIEDELENED